MLNTIRFGKNQDYYRRSFQRWKEKPFMPQWNWAFFFFDWIWMIYRNFSYLWLFSYFIVLLSVWVCVAVATDNYTGYAIVFLLRSCLFAPFVNHYYFLSIDKKMQQNPDHVFGTFFDDMNAATAHAGGNIHLFGKKDEDRK